MDITVYNVYSKYLREKFGEKVYKLPISLPLTCPNRDGCVGTGGCIYWGKREVPLRTCLVPFCKGTGVEE